MNQGCYAIFDKKSGVYNTPWFSLNDQTAIRAFRHLSHNPDSIIAQNEEDYALYRIGQFSDDSGQLLPENQPVWIINAEAKPS